MNQNGYKIVSERINQSTKKDEIPKPVKAIGTGLGAVGLAKFAKPRLMGYKDVYHGTSVDSAKKIKQTGLDPNFGGKEGGVADTFKKDLGSTSPEHLSKGHIYVSPSKTVAQSNANVVQNKKVSLATKKGGSIIHAQIPYQKFIKHFEADPEYATLINPEITRKLNIIATIHGVGSDELKNEFQKIAPQLSKNKRSFFIKHLLAARSKEKINPEQIVGGKGSSFLSRSKEQLKNVPDYVKAHPGRFALGATAALGSGYLAKKTIDQLRKRKEKK